MTSVFNFSITKEGKDTLHVVRESPKRSKAVMAQFARNAAEYTKKGVLKRIPNKKEYKKYRDSLEVSKVTGMPGGAYGFAVHSAAKRGGAQALDTKRSVISIKPKRTASERTKILAKNGPWTADTVPFLPDNPSECTVVRKKSSPRDVDRIRRARKKDKRTWSKELSKAGWRPPRGKDDRSLQGSGTVSDTVLQAKRLEFGIGGEPARAAWRPTLVGLVRRDAKKCMGKKEQIAKAMTDYRFRDWVDWPTKTKTKIKMNDMRKFVGWRDLLGLKV